MSADLLDAVDTLQHARRLLKGLHMAVKGLDAQVERDALESLAMASLDELTKGIETAEACRLRCLGAS